MDKKEFDALNGRLSSIEWQIERLTDQIHKLITHPRFSKKKETFESRLAAIEDEINYAEKRYGSGNDGRK